MKIGYLDCFSGISGDMFLAALVDAGVPFPVLQDPVSALGLGTTLRVGRVDRRGIDAAKVDVLTANGEFAEVADAADHTHPHRTGEDGRSHSHDDSNAHAHEHSGHTHSDEDPHQTHNHEHAHGNGETHTRAHTHGRSLSVIRELIQSSPLPFEVQTIALQAFQLLGEAEAKIHNVPIDTIHFHEVGAVDAIADIVAVAAGCHWLGIDGWLCSPLNVGGGHVHCAHGKFPVPAPATLELLRGLPIYSSGIERELVTPTGAALLRALNVSPSAFPAMAVTATGYGAGSRDLSGQPNVLRLVVGEGTAAASAQQAAFSRDQGISKPGNKVGIIETTIDDATPELLAYVADRLLAAGASDVYRTPIQMKKGRTGMQLTILCAPAEAEALQRLVFKETTTLGLRYREEWKRSLARAFATVETEWGEVRIKIGMLDDGSIVNYAPEYEDCRTLAESHSVPLKQVMQAAVSAYLAQEITA